MISYKARKFLKTSFNCPHCGAYSQQEWFNAYQSTAPGGLVPDLWFAFCRHCKKYSIWRKKRMIYPSCAIGPLPNPDLPDDIKADYEEARSIVSLSPRGAAALLRLAIQKLCKHLGEEGKNLNTDIANLVKKSLPSKVQKSLDIVRVVGNEAVHPGQFDPKDNARIAGKLFSLVNLIAEVMITQPKHVDNLYKSLPEGKKKAIVKRDKRP